MNRANGSTRAPGNRTGVLAAAVCVLVVSGTASAQQGGVAKSGMGQGEAIINVRSDVKISIKGTGGTTTSNLAALGQGLGGQMANIRKCYRELVAKRPTTVGAMKIKVELGDKGGPRLDIEEQGGTDPLLTACVRKTLEKLPTKDLLRPAAAVVLLTFANSRAAGQEALGERMAKQDEVNLLEEEGIFRGSWQAGSGKVSFEVRGEDRASVEATVRTLRTNFAGFVDCRRRANKHGHSPEGSIDVALQLKRGGKSSVKIRNITVSHQRVPKCIERAFKKLDFEGATPGATADVEIAFAK